MSYVWRSILRGIELLREGVVWRIGDGTKIHIWEDPWIPRGVTRRPSAPRGHSLLTRVCELIDPDTGSWDQALVERCFHPDDVPYVLSIPISDQTEDFLAWHFDSKGIFSVKSAYKVHVVVLKREASRQKGQSMSGDATQNEMFRLIWKQKCPPKVQHFLWRLAHNSHPMYMNITR